MAKTIIVSNRLPVRMISGPEGNAFKPSEGGLATALGSIYKEGNNIWLGWPGLAVADEEERAQISRELKSSHMQPVFLSEEEVEQYYLGFSNQTLWPAFHYFVQYIRYDVELWDSYRRVNEKFAAAILEWAEEDDIIWVHDYQLLLVPGLIREKLPQASIGFFQHIPFPSYEVFRTIPWRDELLRGILGSDFVGFHTYDDMRHFLSSVHRLTDYNYRANSVELRDRNVKVDALPMGIDYEKYSQTAQSEDVQKRTKEFRSALGKQRYILSVDRLDYSKGIPGRLAAFRTFMEEHPQYQGQVSLILVVVPSRDVVPSYQQLKDEVDELVGKINGGLATPAWQPLHYFYRSFELISLSAFYRLSDVAMITPLRDGMNLVCKEYVASRYEGKGVLILSEMAGSAKELSEAILVNPNDQAALVRSISEALEMSQQEQERRLRVMQKSLSRYTIFQWVKLYYHNLEQAKQEQKKLRSTQLDQAGVDLITQPLSDAQRRLILLDYDGTLVPFDDDPSSSIPSPELLKLLHSIAQQAQHKLVIISGRTREFLQEHLGSLPISMAAEHGIWFKEENASEWERHVDLPHQRWKNEARTIIEFYVNRTPGSFIEEKQHAMVWHYRRVEPGLGKLRCGELSSHLKHVLGEKGLEVLEGNKVVEVKPSSVNKGLIAQKIKERYKPDVTLAIGDDKTDEYIFAILQDEAFTVKVGQGQTRARYSVSDYRQVHKLLEAIANLNG